FRRARAIGRKHRRDEPVAHAMMHLTIARAHADGGEAFRAWWACRSALAAIEADRGPSHPETAAILEAIARYHAGRPLPQRATPLLKRAMAIRESSSSFDAPETIATALLFASVDQAAGQLARAAATYGRVDRSLSARLGSEHPEVGPVALALATTLRHA